MRKSNYELNEIIQEVKEFLSSETTWQLIKYAYKTKMYRQNLLETIAFRMAIVAGKYSGQKRSLVYQ